MMGSSSPDTGFGDLMFWDSRSELAAELGANDGPVVRLPEAQYTAQWATASVDGTTVVFSLDRAGQTPQATRTDGSALVIVGFNDALMGLDLRARRVAFEFHFDAPFYEFVSAVPGAVVALFETGVASVAADGTMLWRYDSDLIIDWRGQDDSLLLTFADDDPLCLDLRTGRTVP
jgi:hypothetical protein